MELAQLLPLLLVGGVGGLITALTQAWLARRTAARDDRRQAVDQNSALATGAKTLVDSASVVVKLQDDQVAEFRQQIQALQAEVMAVNTRMSREIETRMRVQAELDATTQRLEREMQKNAAMNVRVAELQQGVTNLKAIGERGEELMKINDDLKSQIFDMAKGIMKLKAQLDNAHIEPEYHFEIPAIGD